MSAAIARGDVLRCSVRPDAQGSEKPVRPTGTGIKIRLYSEMERGWAARQWAATPNYAGVAQLAEQLICLSISS